jgi:uncharacterized membrane protein HdeD (DUF308 family)
MRSSVTWKAVSAVGAAALVAGIVCLAAGSEDTASVLFVVGAIEVVGGFGLLAIATFRRKLANNE